MNTLVRMVLKLVLTDYWRKFYYGHFIKMRSIHFTPTVFIKLTYAYHIKSYLISCKTYNHEGMNIPPC